MSVEESDMKKIIMIIIILCYFQPQSAILVSSCCLSFDNFPCLSVVNFLLHSVPKISASNLSAYWTHNESFDGIIGSYLS